MGTSVPARAASLHRGGADKARDHAIGAIEAAAHGLAVKMGAGHDPGRIGPCEFKAAEHVADGIDDGPHAQ